MAVTDEARYDVVVIGAGNAALTAALSAAECGASVLVLEKAPEYLRGGNTYFTYLHWVGTAPPMAGLLRLVCAIPPSEPDVRLSPHPALHQMG